MPLQCLQPSSLAEYSMLWLSQYYSQLSHGMFSDFFSRTTVFCRIKFYSPFGTLKRQLLLQLQSALSCGFQYTGVSVILWYNLSFFSFLPLPLSYFLSLLPLPPLSLLHSLLKKAPVISIFSIHFHHLHLSIQTKHWLIKAPTPLMAASSPLWLLAGLRSHFWKQTG